MSIAKIPSSNGQFCCKPTSAEKEKNERNFSGLLCMLILLLITVFALGSVASNFRTECTLIEPQRLLKVLNCRYGLFSHTYNSGLIIIYYAH